MSALGNVSEAVRDKAKAYLAEGRVQVWEARQDPLVATVLVRGSGDEPYRVLVSGSAVVCSCPARVWACAHVLASLLVLEVREPGPPSGFGEGDAEVDALLLQSGEAAPPSTADSSLSSDDLDALLS